MQAEHRNITWQKNTHKQKSTQVHSLIYTHIFKFTQIKPINTKRNINIDIDKQTNI